MVLSTSEKLTTLATSACVIRRTNSTMVRSVVALSVCEVWASFTSIDRAISSDYRVQLKSAKSSGARKSSTRKSSYGQVLKLLWSATAERSGHGAWINIDSAGPKNPKRRRRCGLPAHSKNCLMPGLCANFKMTMSQIRISTRGAKRIRKGHLWVYRSDVRDVTDAKAGDIVAVIDDTGNFVGQALYSELSEIALRFLTTREETIDREWWRARLRSCAARRQAIARETNAYRLVYSEGDLMPSLIVDVYDQVFVIQTLSQGAERLKSMLVDLLVEEFKPRAIVERNDARVREFEGLELRTGVLYERVSEPGADRGPQAGSPLGGADAAGSDYAASKSEDPVATARGSVTCDCIEINQHDIRFLGSPLSAQNTGPFIDPRA